MPVPIPEPEAFQFTLKNLGLISTGVVTTLGALKYWVIPKIRNGRNGKFPIFTEEIHDLKCGKNLAELVVNLNETISGGFEKMSDKMDTKLGRVYDAIDRRTASGGSRDHRRDD